MLLCRFFLGVYFFTLCVLAASALCCAPAWAYEREAVPTKTGRAQVLRVAVEDDYFPFSFKNVKGAHTGFDVDFAEALCARLQRPCQILPLPFRDIIPAMVAGKVDLAVAGMAKNAEREKDLLYVVPYYRSRTALVGKAGEHYDSVDAQSMKGKRLTAQADTVQEKFIRDALPGAVYVPAATPEEALQAVRDGKADIAFADSLVCMAFLVKDDAQSLDYVAEPLPVKHESSIAYITVKAGNHALSKQVKSAFEQLRVSEEFTAIAQKYFPFSIY